MINHSSHHFITWMQTNLTWASSDSTFLKSASAIVKIWLSVKFRVLNAVCAIRGHIQTWLHAFMHNNKIQLSNPRGCRRPRKHSALKRQRSYDIASVDGTSRAEQSSFAAKMSFLTLACACYDMILLGAGFLALLTVFLVGLILKRLPYSEHFVPKLFHIVTQVDLPPGMVNVESLLGIEMMKALWRMCYLNVKAKLKEGQPFPDAQLIDTTTLERYKKMMYTFYMYI